MHPATVLRLILTGRVTAQKDTNGHWLIDRDSLERWNLNRQRRAQQSEQKKSTTDGVPLFQGVRS